MIIDYYKTKKDFTLINYYNITIYNERLLRDIYHKLKLHHLVYRFPVKAEYWEDIWDQCINPSGSDWKGGGHQSGADTTHDQSKIRYQNKSGQIINNRVHITSHRTKNAGNKLEKKLEFISKDYCDKYVLLSRNEKEWKKGIQSYKLIIFNSDLINFRKLNWSKIIPTKGKNKGKHNGGYIGKGKKNEYEAKIDGPGTSNQLHINLDLTYVGGYYNFILS